MDEQTTQHDPGPEPPASIARAVRALAWDDEGDAARERLAAAVDDDALPLHEAALLAQELGWLEQGLEWLERAVEAAPDDEELKRELDALLEDLGRPARAATPPDEAASEPRPSDGDAYRDTSNDDEGDWGGDPLLEATDADRMRFLHLFGGREDVHARQWCEPGQGHGYSPLRSPLTPGLLRAHVEGATTLGVYLLRLDDTVTFFCLDLDIRRKTLERAEGDPRALERLRGRVHEEGLALLGRLEALGLPALLEDSGYKGRHVWVFLETPLPADLVWKMGRRLLATVARGDADLSVEFFPKQPERSGKGLGNLVKLPLGIHRRSGRRSVLLSNEGSVVRDPWAVLRAVERVSRERFLDAMDALRALPDAPVAASEPTDARGGGERDGKAPRDAGATRSAGGGQGGMAPWRKLTLEQVRAQAEAGPMIAGCAVLDELVARAFSERRLTHDERVVVAHSLGHVAAGVDVVNSIFSACPETPERELLKRGFRGHPVSCARVRKRIPHVTAAVGCWCAFEDVGDYPSPVLHAQGPAVTPAPAARSELEGAAEPLGEAEASDAPASEVAPGEEEA